MSGSPGCSCAGYVRISGSRILGLGGGHRPHFCTSLKCSHKPCRVDGTGNLSAVAVGVEFRKGANDDCCGPRRTRNTGSGTDSRLCKKCTVGGLMGPGAAVRSNGGGMTTCPFPVIHLTRLCLKCTRTCIGCCKGLSKGKTRCFGLVHGHTKLNNVRRARPGTAPRRLVRTIHHRGAMRFVFRKRVF